MSFVKQGVSPASLALAITFGVVIGYIPIFGVHTFLCLLVIWLLRLNPAVVLLANNLAFPLQFILFLPLIRAGEWLFNAPRIPFSATEIFDKAKEDFWGVMLLLWQSTAYALVAWAIVSIPVGLTLYFVLKNIFARFSGSAISQTSSHR